MVEFTYLKNNYGLFESEYQVAILRALRSGWYILGPELEKFEESFAKYLGIKHCVGLNSGTDALILAIRALGIAEGDEVIVPASTYIASVLGITENGAKPVYIDSDKNTLLIDVQKIEAAITDKTKAIVVVHLYGQACDMDSVLNIANKYHIPVIEDCAQCHGAKWNGKLTGTQGTISCFSFYPTKPLGAFGDAGAIVTQDDELADKLKMLRNYGSRIKYQNESIGINSRLDEIQAAALRVGLNHLDETNDMRIRIAGMYLESINNSKIVFPEVNSKASHTYHLFPILVEDQKEFQLYMEKKGIKTQVHYPIPPYVAECYKYQGYNWEDFPVAAYVAKHEVSLPIYSGMQMKDVYEVITAVNSY